MNRTTKEIADALRAATDFDEVRQLADELSPVLQSGESDTVEAKTDLPALRVVECVIPGLVMVISAVAATVGIFALLGSIIGFLVCAWNMDGTGVVHSLIWFAGAGVVVYLGAKAVDALSAWFGKHRVPYFSA